MAFPFPCPNGQLDFQVFCSLRYFAPPHHKIERQSECLKEGQNVLPAWGAKCLSPLKCLAEGQGSSLRKVMDILPLLTKKGRNVRRGKMSAYRQLASYWLAKNCLEEESLSKSSKFCYPSGKVHTVTTKELQPARSVLNDYWTVLRDVLTRSVPICMFRYHGPWNNIAWEMPERWLRYMYIYMGTLHVCDFGKIGLKIGGGGVSRGLSLVY